ncbi:MAG: hypothetical protein CVT88_03885 [Candidatus Altiarchaeales archaeon HGW-Altiarchaeales-1]|nr:MAG: hypothetical protein CVT88_03885 [Candidatus Altiarchaeales archaeon HGW-Altiarchaeales-1]
MAHKCLRCSKIYSDEEILTVKQCIQCGGRFFLSAGTEEDLLKKEELQTPEEKALGVAGEVEVRRVGDVVIVKKIKSKEETEKEIVKEAVGKNIEKTEEVKKPVILEAPSPEQVKFKADFYGWKKYAAEEESKNVVPQIQTSEQRQIEENKQKIDGIMRRGGIEDINTFKPIVIDGKKKEKADVVKVPEEKADVAEEKPKPIPLTDEEWLENVFKDKIDGAVSMDMETLKILRTGKYEIDVPGLMGNKPVIAALREGTYYIDIRSAIEKFQKKKRDEN